jgi:hypothetical protein
MKWRPLRRASFAILAIAASACSDRFHKTELDKHKTELDYIESHLPPDKYRLPLEKYARYYKMENGMIVGDYWTQGFATIPLGTRKWDQLGSDTPLATDTSCGMTYSIVFDPKTRTFQDAGCRLDGGA